MLFIWKCLLCGNRIDLLGRGGVGGAGVWVVGGHQYLGDRPLSQVCNTEQVSPCELEWADLDGRHTDSEVEGYLAYHYVGGGISGCAGARSCDVSETFAKMGDLAKYQKGRSIFQEIPNRDYVEYR